MSDVNDMSDLLAGADDQTEELIDTPATGDEVDPSDDPQIADTYLRDLTEDDVYNRLGQVNEFPNHLNAIESRFNGGMTEFNDRLTGLEKSVPTQVGFDSDALSKGLEAYDPKLAEVLVPLLQEVFKVSALDENTLRPHLDTVQSGMKGYVGEQIVASAYSPETLNEIIPTVTDGKFAPEGQRQKDFVDWYSQQGYQTQQALLTFGAPYVNALRSFENWEGTRNSGRATDAKNKTDRLAKGQMPTSQHRRTPKVKTISDDEAFANGFNEVFNEG